MSWKIKVTASASQDIKAIKQWYQKASLQSLKNFVADLTASFDALKTNLIDFQPVYKNYRKIPLKRFPYSILYQRKENELTIIVYAVFHKQRDSDSFMERIHEE